MFRKLLLLTILVSVWALQAFALEVKIIEIDPANGHTIEDNKSSQILTRGDMFELIWELLDQELRPSYEFIALQYKDVKKGTDWYETLQKMVFLWVIDNQPSKIFMEKNISAYGFYAFMEKTLSRQIITDTPTTIQKLKSRYANQYDIEKVREAMAFEEKIEQTSYKGLEEKKEIFNDVYKTLLQEHYNQENLNPEDLIYSAIQWLADGTKDQYTVYFPPIESKNFEDNLAGEFEGIGAYVDMYEPWVLTVKSPITGWPAEKAWVKAWDIITKVDDKIITEKNSLLEVVSWIKWPKWTDVVLEILRWDKTLTITVTRDKIVVKDVEIKDMWNQTLLVNMKNFWAHSHTEFKDIVIEELANKKYNKIIFDLRNNPGGYLASVNEILSYFVPKWQAVSQIRYIDYTLDNKSKGYSDIDFSKYRLFALQNWGTASASEIFIGTLRDYFPDMQVIWEKSFGKGSVQTIRSYVDGSSLKYTVAKWFTGKSNAGIDGVGIEPNTLLEYDLELFQSKGIDNQLKKALDL